MGHDSIRLPSVAFCPYYGPRFEERMRTRSKNMSEIVAAGDEFLMGKKELIVHASQELYEADDNETRLYLNVLLVL